MYCTKCGNDNKSDASFCGVCGANLLQKSKSNPKTNNGFWVVIGITIFVSVCTIGGIVYEIGDFINESMKEESYDYAENGIDDDISYDDELLVGDSVLYEGNDGSKGVMEFIEWGTIYDYDREEITYINVEFTNTGNQDSWVGASDFDMYADGYIVDRTYPFETYGKDYLSSGYISPGKKTKGYVFFDLDPDYADEIEVEFAGCTYILK